MLCVSLAKRIKQNVQFQKHQSKANSHRKAKYILNIGVYHMVP
jgi:hypothetical protein